MLKGLRKLKDKLESQPFTVVTQPQLLEFPIHIFNLNDEIDPNSIVSICNLYKKEEYREKKTESVYAWRSDYTQVADNKMPEFTTLFKIVESKIDKIWKFHKIYTFTLDHFWFAIYQKGDSSKIHDHGYVDFACVYYANYPKNSAPLVIPTTNGDLSLNLKQGDLVVIPGNCNHRVPLSEHEGERIIVAMNIIKDQYKGYKGDLK